MLTVVADRMSGSHNDPVVVVGGDVIGVCCAYFLAKTGVRVLLLERDEICSGCSFGNLGLLAASHSVPLASPGVICKALQLMFNNESPFSIRSRADPQLAAWLWRFFRASRADGAFAATSALLKLVLASMALFEELASSKDVAFALEQRGVLELFATSKAYEEAANSAASLRAIGLRVDVLDAREAQAFEPLVVPGVRGGLLYLDDCHVLPAKFVRGLAVLAANAGAEIRDHTAVTDFSVSGNRVMGVKTPTSFHRASAVILAAGSSSPKLGNRLGIKLPVEPACGYFFTTTTPARSLFRPIMFSEVKALGRLLLPWEMNCALVEFWNLRKSMHRLTRGVLTRCANALVKSVNRYLLPEVSFDGVEPWSGYRPCSLDGFHIVGWSQRWSNLLYATGHGMLGLTLGPLTGEISTALVTGADPQYNMDRLLPSRFEDSL
jgi:D-amino-acid dehydrogenase